MPFDFKSYAVECSQMSPIRLQQEWQKYTRSKYSAGTSFIISGAMLLPTAGISSVGTGISTLALYNARQKRKIIEKNMRERWERMPETRKRDIIAAVSISTVINSSMIWIGDLGGSQIATEAVAHSWAPILAHPDAVKLGVEVVTGAAGSTIEDREEKHFEKKRLSKS